MQNRPLRVEVEALHVDEASVTGRHQHRNSTRSGLLSHDRLHIQRIAFVDSDIEAVEKFVNGVQRQARFEDPHRQVGVEFGDSARGRLGLVQPDVEHRRRDPVEIAQLQLVEIRQPEFAAQALGSERVRDDVTGAQPDDADPQRTQSRLFVDCDHIPVAVQPHRPKTPRAQYCHCRPPPGVVRPPATFVEQLGARWWQQPAQFRQLRFAVIDEVDVRFGA